MLAVDTGPHLFWITSRAAGIAALLLSSAAVGVGVTMGGRLVRARGPDLRVTHEALSLATMAALAVHALSLLGDRFLKPSLADVTVPFASSYREPWMAIGLVGGWLLVLLGLSYYVRGRIGVPRWRVLHRFTALAWVLGIVHTLGEGTDTGQAWFLAAVAATTLPAAALAVMRVSGTRRSAPPPTPRPPASRSAARAFLATSPRP
jgi:methionine sulfoxide reductase heme-binding subunit